MLKVIHKTTDASHQQQVRELAIRWIDNDLKRQERRRLQQHNLRNMTMTYDDKVFKAIERLTGNHLVSVVAESSKYCYKTFAGVIGTVDMSFISDRINAGLY